MINIKNSFDKGFRFTILSALGQLQVSYEVFIIKISSLYNDTTLIHIFTRKLTKTQAQLL